MEGENNMEEIDGEIKKLKMQKSKIKQANDRSLRLRSNNCGKSNVLIRVSLNFQKKIDHINSERDANGLDCLSGPKITELLISHKKHSPIVERDIIRYNTLLETDEGAEFDDK